MLCFVFMDLNRVEKYKISPNLQNDMYIVYKVMMFGS